MENYTDTMNENWENSTPSYFLLLLLVNFTILLKVPYVYVQAK